MKRLVESNIRIHRDSEDFAGLSFVIAPFFAYFAMVLKSTGSPGQHTSEDERWMESALREAEKAAARKEVPVGAVVTLNGRIIGKGYNQIESLKDPTAHAEIIAITAAAMHIGDRRLESCALYVTLEPCVMCAGAIVLARIPRLIYGAPDPKAGACESLYQIPQDKRLNHRVEVQSGVLQEDCSTILKDFFARVRADMVGKPGKT